MYTIYTKTNCIQCKMVKQRMQAKGIKFIEINIEDNPKVVKRLKDKGIAAVPAVFKGTKYLFTGFRIDKIDALKE